MDDRQYLVETDSAIKIRFSGTANSGELDLSGSPKAL